MSTIEIRVATAEDAQHIAKNLRKCDLREAQATVGDDVEGAMLASFEASTLCWCASVGEGAPFIIFGVAPSDVPGMGIPWMLATDGLKPHTREFLRATRWYVHLMHSAYPILYNFVDKRNAATKRWLKWAGFTLGADVPEFGSAKVPFTLFYRTSNV